MEYLKVQPILDRDANGS